MLLSRSTAAVLADDPLGGIELLEVGHHSLYGAYVLAPDGNNVEAVPHGPATRSVASVVVTPEED